METVPRLYPAVRPGADYRASLALLARFGERHPEVPTKSGIMLGLGEGREEVLEVLADLRAHGVSLVTIGQYLQPSAHHHPVLRYWTPEEFAELGREARSMGFRDVAAGPFVRSSYHADRMAVRSGVVEEAT